MRSSGIRLGLLLLGITLILAGVFLTAFPQWVTWPGVVLVVATLWDKVLGWAERLHALTKGDTESSSTPPSPQTSGDRSPIHTGRGDINLTEGGDVVYGNQEIHLPPPKEPPPDTIGYIPPASTETYIHRGRIEENLLKRLQSGEHAAIAGVTGVGGIGKTEMAKQLAKRLAGRYRVVWIFVGAKTATQILPELLQALGVEPQNTSQEQLVALRHAYAQAKETPLLVVFDDVRTKAIEGLSNLLPTPPSAALITSRIRQNPRRTYRKFECVNP